MNVCTCIFRVDGSSLADLSSASSSASRASDQSAADEGYSLFCLNACFFCVSSSMGQSLSAVVILLLACFVYSNYFQLWTRNQMIMRAPTAKEWALICSPRRAVHSFSSVSLFGVSLRLWNSHSTFLREQSCICKEIQSSY